MLNQLAWRQASDAELEQIQVTQSMGHCLPGCVISEQVPPPPPPPPPFMLP